MSEWWTYRLGSFLMFSPATYARLVEQYNADVWPLQPVAGVLGAASLVLAWRARSTLHGRFVWSLLGGAWLWVAWAFFHQRFAPINWAASYVAWAWSAQGLALVWLGAVRGRIEWRRDVVGRAAAAMIVGAALLGYPMFGPVLRGTWAQAESFAVMPDPTAAATLGFLLLARRPPPWLLAVPALSCLLSGAQSWALGAPAAWLSPLLAGLAVACAWGLRRRPAAGPGFATRDA